MSEKQKKPAMSQEENDRMMNRLMLAFVIAVMAVTVIMSLKNRFNTIVMYETVAPVMSVICFLLFAFALGFFLYRIKKGTNDSLRVITKYNVLGTGIASLLCGIVYFVNPGIASVYSVVIVIGACALYFIRYIYSLPFLALSAFCLCEGLLIHAGFGLATVRTLSVILGLLLRVGALVLPILFAIAVGVLIKKKPKFFRDSRPLPLYLCAAVALLGAVILMLSSFGIFYVSYVYVLYALAAAFLAVGIIETVKSI